MPNNGAVTLDFSKAQPLTLDFSKSQPLTPPVGLMPVPVGLVSGRNPRTGLPQTVNDVTGIPTAAAAVGSLAGPEGTAAGAGLGTTADAMLHGTPAGDAAWEGAKNALWTEIGGRGLSLISKFGAPLLNKVVDLFDEYETKLPKTPSINPLNYIERKPPGMSGSASSEDAAKAAFMNRGYKPSAATAPKPTPPMAPGPVGTSTAAGTLSEMANGFKLPPVPATPAPAPAAMVTKAVAEEAPKSRTIFVPMKSSPQPESAKLGDLWTIPRDKLVDLAKSGNSSAATVLQRLGHKVIFVPNPE